MLDWLFGNKKYNHLNNSMNKQLEMPTQEDSMDLLIRKIVPDVYLKTWHRIGEITKEDATYSINLSYKFSHYQKNEQVHKNCIEICKYRRIDINYNLHRSCYLYQISKSEECQFINQHFDQIVKFLYDYVDKKKRLELEKLAEEKESVRCQEKLSQKVEQYINQNL